SGHVKQISGDPAHDGEKVAEFLWSTDNKFISDHDLATQMNKLQGWAWVNISGCESAGFDNGIASARHLFTASSEENEKSYEDANWHNSIFTGLMVDQGMIHKSADANSDGKVTIQEAFAFAQSNAPVLTAKQKQGPQHPYIAGGDGGAWLLNPPPP